MATPLTFCLLIFFLSEREVPRTCQKLGRLGLRECLFTNEARYSMYVLCRFQHEQCLPLNAQGDPGRLARVSSEQIPVGGSRGLS